MVEIIRSFVETSPSGFRAYLALQCALMRHYVARGGTEEEFCVRLAPVFHRRFAPVLLYRGGAE
ncbi:MAG: hypothetical protein M3409_07765 [Gemmatimonadota bacterium]|jgi:hypothetical protein|nr:hypothetical protein [Gemmatimonadota bacterium]